MTEVIELKLAQDESRSVRTCLAKNINLSEKLQLIRNIKGINKKEFACLKLFI